MQRLRERTVLLPREITERVRALIVTLGGKDSHVHVKNHRIGMSPPRRVFQEAFGYHL